MINYNPIQTLKLDIDFIGIKESNNYLFDKVSDLSKGEVTMVLSDFFDDPRFDQIIYQFNLLEFDLGIIPYIDFEQTFIERIKIELNKKFNKIFENKDNSSDFILKNNESNTIELIKFYLLNGRLPWWSGKLGNNSISSIISEFIQSHPKHFRTLLLEIGIVENVRKRIAYNFTEELIKLVIKVLSPAEFDYIFVYHDYVLKLNNDNKLIIDAESNVSRAIWYNIIIYLLTENSSVFQKREFLKRNLIYVSSYFNINFYGLLKLLNDASVISNNIFNSDMYNFIKDIQYIFQEEKINNPKAISDSNKNAIKEYVHYELDDEYFNYIYIINYYLTNGSLPIGYNLYSIDELKQLFYKLYSYDVKIVSKLLLNLKINTGTTNRIFKILSTTNYKYAIDLILNQYLNIDLNDIHKTFIQLRINNNRSTTIFLSDDWKREILNIVYTHKETITIHHIFQLYLSKYATTDNISFNTAFEIYVKDLRLQNNQYILNMLSESDNISLDIKIDDVDYMTKNKSIFDLIQYLIEFGYMPWWGIELFEVSFRATFEKHFDDNFIHYIKLLKVAGLNEDTKSRFFNLLGDNRLEFLLLKIVNDDNTTSLYYSLKNYIESYYNNIKSSEIIDILWNTQINNNYLKFDTSLFIRNIIVKLYKAKKTKLKIIVNDLVNHIQPINDSNINIFNNILLLNRGHLSIDNELLFNLKIQIAEIVHEKNYNSKVLQDFILLISSNNSQSITNFSDKLSIDLINNILYNGKFPISLNTFPNISTELFLFTLLEYLYINNKEQLKSILLNFDLYNDDAKQLLTDWIFNTKDSPFLSYVTDTILPLNRYHFLNNINRNLNIGLLNSNQFNPDIISNFNTYLNIRINTSNNEVQEKYKLTLHKYLHEETFEVEFEQQDQILKYLIISIYASEFNFLFNILNSQDTSQIAKQRLLKLFSKPVNFQERQIYDTLLRSIGDHKLVIDDIISEPLIDIKPIQIQENKVRTDLKYSILEYLNLKQISDKSFIEILRSLILSFFSNTNEINIFKKYFQEDFDYYLKLMILEVVKDSPSDFLALLRNDNNKQANIIHAFQYFTNDKLNLGITTKNVFKDYFDDYLTKIVFKSSNIQYEINNLISNHTINNNNDLQYLINSKLIIYNDISLLDKFNIDISNKFSKQNIALLKIVLFEMKNSFTIKNEQQLFDLILTRSIVNNSLIINNTGNPTQFLNTLLNVLHDEHVDQVENYLIKIIDRFKTTSISYPYDLVLLINFVIDKATKIINQQKASIAHKKELIQKNIDIENSTKQLKKLHEEERDEIQSKKINEQLLNSKYNSDEINPNESIYINNIGLVLFHLFIPTYFSRLNLLNEEGEFIDIDAKFKAVHLLQILVSDSKYDEHELVLNKILCNLNISETIPMEVELSEDDRNLALELNKVVLQRWDKMKNSSIEHFRAAFLMRDGRLQLKEEGWYLTVEKRGYDIILSTLPWAFGVVKFKWMPKFLYTEWT